MNNEIKDYLFNCLSDEQKKVLRAYLKNKNTYEGKDDIKTEIKIIAGIKG